MFNIIKNMYKNYLLKKEIVYIYKNTTFSSYEKLIEEYAIFNHRVGIWGEGAFYDNFRIEMHNNENYDGKMTIHLLLARNKTWIEKISIEYKNYSNSFYISLDSHYDKLHQPIKKEVYRIVHQLYKTKRIEVELQKQDEMMDAYKFLNIPVEKIKKYIK